MLRGKYVALEGYIRKEKRFQINGPNSNFEKLEKEEQNKFKAIQKNEIIGLKYR